MAVKIYDTKNHIKREIRRSVAVSETETRTVTDIFFHTDFIADDTSDITAMNAAGSEYLNYPAGSAALCIEDGNVYILNASETAYEIPGGSEE